MSLLRLVQLLHAAHCELCPCGYYSDENSVAACKLQPLAGGCACNEYLSLNSTHGTAECLPCSQEAPFAPAGMPGEQWTCSCTDDPAVGCPTDAPTSAPTATRCDCGFYLSLATDSDGSGTCVAQAFTSAGCDADQYLKTSEQDQSQAFCADCPTGRFSRPLFGAAIAPLCECLITPVTPTSLLLTAVPTVAPTASPTGPLHSHYRR